MRYTCLVLNDENWEWPHSNAVGFLRLKIEKEEYQKTFDTYENGMGTKLVCPSYQTFDWLNAYHFDYRGLIELGLALEAPQNMYI